MTTKTRLLPPLLAAAGCILLSGCGLMPFPLRGPLPVTPVLPPTGGIFTNIKAPLTVDHTGVGSGSKVGTASTMFIREPIFQTSYAWQDASIKSAAASGNISKIAYADYELLTVLGLFGQFTVRVYGD